MNVEAKGCRNLAIIAAILFVGVYLIPIVLLPSVGSAVTLPVITLPAEYYRSEWPGWLYNGFGFELVNTLGGALLANVIVLLIAFGAWRASNGWKKKVPGRFQGAVEALVGGLWSLTKSQAGDKPKVRNYLYPLVAGMFLFLLAANWGKLIPGVESVGVLHCANYNPVVLNGFPVNEVNSPVGTYYQYRVESPLQTGTPATSTSYRQCEAVIGEHKYMKDYLPTALDPWQDQAVTHTTSEGDTLSAIIAQYEAQAAEAASQPLPESENREEVRREIENGDWYSIEIHYDDPYAIYQEWREVDITPAEVLAANAGADGIVNLDFAGVDENGATGEAFEMGDATYYLPAGATLDTPLVADQMLTVRPELFGADATTRSNQLYTVAPFVRGVATDLSFTIGLALLAFVAFQVFGVWELGIKQYGYKFINLPALGNAGKNPIGGVDFLVGLFEIISEIGKVVSLAFRLFGALFAGTVLFAVMMFLTGTVIPVLILLLELIVGAAQAGVFAILTLIFSAQAMVSHHHDDDEHEH